MKNSTNFIKWTFHHAWVILVSYLAGTILLLIIHGSFGFTMNDDGTHLSNALMHIGSGFVLAFGTGILQIVLLKKHFQVSYSWVLSLITGFVIAELLAGIVLWKLEIYRGLINIFNTTNHLPEALIFALAGLIAGILQYSLLKSYCTKRVFWIISSTLGWGLLILSTYLGIVAFLFGALFYGAISGLALYKLMEFK